MATNLVLHSLDYFFSCKLTKEAKQPNIKMDTGQYVIKNLTLPKKKSGLCPVCGKEPLNSWNLPSDSCISVIHGGTLRRHFSLC